MKRRLAAGAVALCIVGVASAVPAGADGPPERAHAPAPGPTSGGSPGSTYIRRAASPPPSAQARTPAADTLPQADASTTAPRGASAFVPPPNEDFVLEFHDVSPSRRAVFEAAAGIWSEVLEVEVPIDVRVRTRSMPRGILGGATPTDMHVNDISFPLQDVWFVSAHANQYARRDLDPSQPEIDIEISSDFDFYDGIDDQVPDDQISLLNLALHELGHGLGHITLARPVAGSWSINWPTPRGTPLPLAYDLLLVDPARTPLVGLTGGALGSALTSRVLWNGGEGIIADGDLLPEIYAPSTFQPGSSTSHLDERTYPDALMTPSIADGEVQLEIPALTQAMFADFGWGLEVTGRDPSFVTALTRDFLFAFPKPTQIDAVVDLLRRGTSRSQLVSMYANSDAYLGRLIDSYYLSTLGRPADPAGKQHWLRELRGGRTPASVAAGFYASSEYFHIAGSTHRGWLTDLYVEIMGRQPDPGGLATWTGKATSGAPRTDIAFAFYQSVESRSKRVTDLYRHLLGRPPDPGGLTHWRQVLDNGRDVQLAIALARSPEYQDAAVRRYG